MNLCLSWLCSFLDGYERVTPQGHFRSKMRSQKNNTLFSKYGADTSEMVIDDSSNIHSASVVILFIFQLRTTFSQQIFLSFFTLLY